VLATSREILRVSGEYVLRVPPLGVPSPTPEGFADLLGHNAAELFFARTRAQDAAFATDSTHLSAVAAICRHLDGIPLSIEFAAARAATLGVPQVAAMLDDRFRLLAGARRTALPRHQTLRAALDWSYELLHPDEAVLLGQLAVFAGEFSLEAAVAVIGDAPMRVADKIASLVAKSLIVAEPRDGDVARDHPTVRPGESARNG
jgi:non-specific serine/threonine protein kinase